MSEIKVRKMISDDLDWIIDLERRAFSDPWPRQSFRETLSEPMSGGLVAEIFSGGQWRRVGYGCYFSGGGETHVTNIAVEPQFRRQSVGRRLLESALARAIADESDLMILEVRSSNRDAIEFYSRQGFHELYRRAAYYDNPREDAIVFARAIKTTQPDNTRNSYDASDADSKKRR